LTQQASSIMVRNAKELTELSTNGTQFIINGTHGTIITKKKMLK
jgi:hypothetical protein